MKKNIILFLYGSITHIWMLHAQSVQLHQLFYHRGPMSDSVVCYFDKKPTCKPIMLPSKPDPQGFVQTELDLPDVVLSTPAARAMLETVNKTQSEDYCIMIKEIKKPHGLRISIRYNPEKISCQYAQCTSISMQQGLVINLHNKSTLNLIRDHTEGVLQSVRYSPSQAKPKVVLDFGHGGTDLGKVGCYGLYEKDINMQVGFELSSLLKKKGYTVLLTRSKDITVPLDARTTLANFDKADLFVSIHSNAGPKTAQGIETYWTPKMLLQWQTWGKRDKGVDFFLKNLDDQSKLLASLIHKQVVFSAQKTHASIKDRGQKESIAQVLLGTAMPSALVEIGFLSHEQEALRLTDKKFQRILARGIANGIDDFCRLSRRI